MKPLRTPTVSLQRPGLLNLMYLPALAIVAWIIYYPMVQGFVISTREWDGFSAGSTFVGLDKYARLATDPVFYQVLVNTLIYGFGSTLLQTILGLSLALLLDDSRLGSKLVRTIVYLPAIISPLIMGYVWHFFFQYSGGALNDLMAVFGLEAQDWLSQSGWTVLFIVLINSLQYCGVAMIIYLAGLQAIPHDFIEAARIDGARPMDIFLHVKVPLLMPAITFSTIVNLIGGLKLFDVIVALTQGGPGFTTSSISTMVQSTFFVRNDAGYASAMGMVMFVLIFAFTLVALRFFSKREVEL